MKNCEKNDMDLKRLLESLCREIKKEYIFPEIGIKIEQLLLRNLKNGLYEKCTNETVLCEKVNADLYKVSQDQHLRIFYTGEEDTTSKDEKYQELMYPKEHNYGFYQVKRLSGNIGYIDLRSFSDPIIASETATQAMGLISETKALIIDLRKNGGGSPWMVAFFISYFFDNTPFHLNTFYIRQDDSTIQTWTVPYLPGKRYVAKPVYLLTSKETFSAAEEFSYSLKYLKRAKIIGEVTKGGANPGDIYSITEQISAFIPNAKVIHPITKSNWEHTGVQPDVEAQAKEAFNIAYREALNDVIECYRKHQADNPMLREALLEREKLTER